MEPINQLKDSEKCSTSEFGIHFVSLLEDVDREAGRGSETEDDSQVISWEDQEAW